MRKTLIISASAACLATSAFAQTPSATGEVQGVLKTFTLTPVGDVEGLILGDGTEVHVPPHLTPQIVSAVHSGERVSVRGWRVGIPNFLVATSLTGQTGQNVVDNGPPPPGSLPPPIEQASNARTDVTTGRVSQLLHGPAGDVNGALLRALASTPVDATETKPS